MTKLLGCLFESGMAPPLTSFRAIAIGKQMMVTRLTTLPIRSRAELNHKLWSKVRRYIIVGRHLIFEP